ncbi:MAG: hypothetical protein RSE27_03590 [Ruthenibacterium sp.]
MSITRGTTPTLFLRVTGVNPAACKTLCVTLKQGAVSLDKTGAALVFAENMLQIHLTQAETLLFGAYDAEIQLRGITNEDEAFASSIVTVPFARILKEGVLHDNA